jgi:hypothetical protein
MNAERQLRTREKLPLLAKEFPSGISLESSVNGWRQPNAQVAYSEYVRIEMRIKRQEKHHNNKYLSLCLNIRIIRGGLVGFDQKILI